ncbi:MAG: D-alanyl-D-alanine carboxypeptidase/D-alanyl-D-alanine-endopeptidase [Saprospiraceae bacterium]
MKILLNNTCFLFFIGLFFSISACSPKLITKKEQKSLHQQIANSSIFNQGFTGFQVYDPASKTVLYEQFADKYFTPASNTKIFTFYAAAKILGDTIPALKYQIQGDSLIFWGTGDPSLFHPKLPFNRKVIDFLNSRSEQLFYCPDNFMDARYGTGWMWDDYPYYFQPELAGLPIHGNFIRIQGKKNSTNFNITPNYFTNKINGQPSLGGKTARFYRQEQQNIIDYNQQAVGQKDFDRSLPFIYTDTLALQILQDSLQKAVQLLPNFGTSTANGQLIYSIPTDSVQQRMMQISDNFLAEQLMLLVSNTVFDTMNIAKGIQFAKDSLLSDAPDALLWQDGSGLTRYNQFTPRSMVYVLEKIYTEIPKERWLHVFPAGGVSGTIKNNFGSATEPYLYAKTGSMRHVRCLSGYLFTRSGKTLIFSFMNNHIPGSSRPWTKEMEQVLAWMYEEL